MTTAPTPANPYPVDSATRPCCGGIGTHTRNCDSRDLVAEFKAIWARLTFADKQKVVDFAVRSALGMPAAETNEGGDR